MVMFWVLAASTNSFALSKLFKAICEELHATSQLSVFLELTQDVQLSAPGWVPQPFTNQSLGPSALFFSFGDD